MVDKEISAHLPFTHDLTASTFLAAVTFAALILLMQSEEKFDFPAWSTVIYYPELLIGALAVLAVMFSTSLIGIYETAVEAAKPESEYSYWSKIIWNLAWLGLIGIIPFLVLPFSVVGAIAVGILAIVLIARLLTLPY